jgi:TatD DNase family protein
MILTDTHAHLYASQFDEDRDEMIQRAFDSEIKRIFLPNIDVSSIEPMLKLAETYKGHCSPMIGLHPCSVDGQFEKTLEETEKALANHKFYAIGEIGIDLYWDKTTLPEQQTAFKIQVEWAKKLGLPIVIHCRDSFNEITEMLDKLNDESLSGIFHCFTGSLEQAEKIIGYGNFKLGVGGIVTFKNGGLAEVLPGIPLEHIVLETDAPYLSPNPYRGKRNESAYLIQIAEKLAGIYQRPLEEIAEITTQNSREIFGT